MMGEHRMNAVREGQRARVVKIGQEGRMRRRLQDLGFVEGAPVRCLQKAPSGDPVAFLIRGSVIALREEDASAILVELLE